MGQREPNMDGKKRQRGADGVIWAEGQERTEGNRGTAGRDSHTWLLFQLVAVVINHYQNRIQPRKILKIQQPFKVKEQYLVSMVTANHVTAQPSVI